MAVAHGALRTGRSASKSSVMASILAEPHIPASEACQYSCYPY